MTEDSEDPHHKARECCAAPECLALKSLLEAVAAARGVNDPVRRDAARTAIGAALSELMTVTGAATELQAQMVEHVLEETGDDSFADKTWEDLTRPDMMQTPGRRAILKGLAERGVMSLFALLGARFSAATVHDLRGRDSGREGLFSFQPKAGVSPASGPAHALQEVTVARLGYTVGSSSNGLLKKDHLKRAVAYYNSRGQEHGISETRHNVVRDWTQRGHLKLFQQARREGLNDRENGSVDPGRVL